MVSYRDSFPSPGVAPRERGRAVASFDPEPVRPRPRRNPYIERSEGKPAPKQPAFERAIKLCSVRERSQHELVTRLQADGYPADEVRAAVERAVSCNLVNDERFADAYVRGRLSAGKGSVAIKRELRDKFGVDVTAFDEQLEECGLDEDSQMTRALSWLESHPPRSKDQYAGAYRKLVTKGYAGGIAAAAARAWLDEHR